MSYIQQHLLSDEQIIYETRLHKIIFVAPVIICLFLLFLFSILSAFSLGYLIIWLIFSILIILSVILKYKFSEFGITNKRVLIKTGVFHRRSFEILLSKIEGVAVNQDLLGRLLDYGTIVVMGVGGSKEPFSSIKSPFEFRKLVHRHLIEK